MCVVLELSCNCLPSCGTEVCTCFGGPFTGVTGCDDVSGWR